MTQHATALAELEGWRPPTADQVVARDGFVGHLRAHPDGLRRSCFPHHLTAGALVLSEDRGRVLLNLHRKAGRWFHFGGHIEAADDSLAAAALRESREESGIGALELAPEPLQLSAHAVPFCDPRGEVTHLDVRYLALAPASAIPVASEESESVRWFPVDALPTDDPDMLELVRMALASR